MTDRELVDVMRDICGFSKKTEKELNYEQVEHAIGEILTKECQWL